MHLDRARIFRGCVCAASLGLAATFAAATALARQADWQLTTEASRTGAVVVRSVQTDSAAARGGIRVGDRIVAIDGRTINGAQDVLRARHASKGGLEVAFRVERDGASDLVRFVPPELPRESHPGIETIYESARSSRGFDVRLVVTRPSGAGPRPAVVFVPWLSCDPVDYPAGPTDGWARLLFDLVRSSGSVVVRIEKAGVGDSTGPNCMDADLEDDLSGFRAGLVAAAKLPYVDADRMFLFGGSIGGALAPILAQEVRLSGIIVSGGFYKTWLEHMLELERRRLTLAGRAPGEVSVALAGFADFYSLYLNGRATPAAVGAVRPDLAPLWYDGPEHQYGRPARYYHQLQALNVARAWEVVDARVLVIHGEYDWIMSREDQELLVAALNRKRANTARLILVPRMGHNIETFASLDKAFEDGGGRYASAVAREITRWLHAHAVVRR